MYNLQPPFFDSAHVVVNAGLFPSQILVLLAAGWEIENKDIPIQIFMIGGGMWSGMRINMHAVVKDSIQIADDSPEKQFHGCITTVALGAAGAIIPYNDIPTGVVRILVSGQP